jgi:Trk K+ transport system NAD-binding subunit
MMHVIVAGGGTVGQRVAQAVHAAGNTVAMVRTSRLRRRLRPGGLGDACSSATRRAGH